MNTSIEKSGTGIEKNGTGVEKSGTGLNWTELQRRVSRGLATNDDAESVERIGLLPQATRIRKGLADRGDALLISLQVEMLLREVAA